MGEGVGADPPAIHSQTAFSAGLRSHSHTLTPAAHPSNPGEKLAFLVVEKLNS